MAIKEADAAKLIVGSAAEATQAHAMMTGMAMPKALAPADFCGLWKTAKPLLETAATFLSFPFVPAGPAAAGVLRGLIKVGDQIAAGMNCP